MFWKCKYTNFNPWSIMVSKLSHRVIVSEFNSRRMTLTSDLVFIFKLRCSFLLFWRHSNRADCFAILSIYGQLYSTFRFHLVLLALFFVDGKSRLCILDHSGMGWNIRHSWSCCILLGAWIGRDIFEESSHSWILSWYQIDYISFETFRQGLWHRPNRLWWVFGCICR